MTASDEPDRIRGDAIDAVLLRLLLVTALSVVVGHLLFTWGDRRARRLGLIDRASSW